MNTSEVDYFLEIVKKIKNIYLTCVTCISNIIHVSKYVETVFILF